MRTLVIADDLTGAAEIAGVAHRLGCRVRLTTSVDGFREEDEVVVVATDTRSMSHEEALRTTLALAAAIRRLDRRPDRLFKKTDSVLRGHILGELTPLLDESHPSALLLPANPSKGRLIRRRIYTIDGTPLARTLFRHDPEFPARSSDVVKRLGGGIPYMTTRTRRKHLPAGVSLGEVGSMTDLQSWVARFDGPTTLWAGGADLFQTLLEKQGHSVAAEEPFEGLGRRRALIVLGSTARHDLFTSPFFERNCVAISPMPDEVFEGGETTVWIEEACTAGLKADSLLLRIPQQITHAEGKALQLRHQMACAAKALIERLQPDEVIIEGGATAFTILNLLGWDNLRIANEIAPGVVRLHHAADNTYLTFKPGSYPWGECFR